MKINKEDILNNICYTELVYSRINKKLKTKYSKLEIEELIFSIIKKTEEIFFHSIGKNIYVESAESSIRICINSNTYRIITVDKIKI